MKRTKILLATSALLLSVCFLLAFKVREHVLNEKQATMVADWERAKAYTLDYINAASEEAITSRPTAEMRTFAQQYLHICEANFGIIAGATGKQSPYGFGALEKSDQYNTKAALSKVVAESYDFVIAGVKEMNETKFAETFHLFKWDLTKEAAFQKAFEHQTHHRGQTTVYLRVKGIKPPEEQLF